MEEESWLDTLALQGAFLPKPEPLSSAVRLLSGDELEGAISHVLGMEASSSVQTPNVHGQYKGYASSQELSLDSHILDQYLDYATQRVEAYVNSKMETDFPCLRNSAETDNCQKELVDTLASKAFRGRFDQELGQELLSFYREKVSEGRSLARSLLLQRIFMSPYFIYRQEGLQAVESGSLMSQLEIAEFLSFVVASTPPPVDVIEAAQAGRLTKDFIEKWVLQLMQTPRARRNMVRFFKNWLSLDQLDQMAASPELFSKLTDPAQGRALAREFELTIEDLVFSGAKFEQLFTFHEGFVNRQTASLYGLNQDSNNFQKVSLNPSQRSGILTLASVMAAHGAEANPSIDRPIPRGLVVKERVLCGEVGLPSGLDINNAAANIDPSRHNFDQMTVRDRLDVIMQQEASCVSCHAQFMPYGFLMSNYGALGQWQFQQNGQPIDSAVDEVFLDERESSYQSFVQFSKSLSQSRQARQCFAEQYLTAVLGRSLGDARPHLVGLGALELRANEEQLLQFMAKVLTHASLYLRERGVTE